MTPLHIAAASRGVLPGQGCACAVCGPSPFDVGRPTSDVFGPNFTDYELVHDAAQPSVCAGCVSLLAGRPGDDPPPLRTMHALAVDGETVVYPATRDLADVLRHPPERPFVLTWTATRQRHAILRAGLSTSTEIRIGTERGTAVYRPAEHEPVLDAIEAMRAVFTPDEIAGGQYPPAKLAGALGLHQRCEPLIAPHRGAILLDLLVAVVRKPEQPHQEVPLAQLDDDMDAAHLLADIAQASNLRRKDGLAFWGQVFQRRLTAVRHMPLPDLVARLMDRLECRATDPAIERVTQFLRTRSDDEADRVRRALAHRAAIVVALALSIHKQRREDAA